MLIFHGGLPRSGKSFESIKKHLVPALKNGRHVYARIDGLNFEKLAELAGIPVDRCRELLHEISEEQVTKFHLDEHVTGSLFIIDEIQNYFPDTREPLPAEITKWVAEHGHEGHDVLLMGQDFRDMHKLFKNRVSQRVIFNKLDMLGKGDSYRWTLEKAVRPGKFASVSSGQEKYDPAYFGSYKSFVPGAENNQLYDDKRASLWNSSFFKKTVPVAVVAIGFAIYYVVDLFNGGLEKDLTKAHKKPATAQGQAAVVPARPAPAASSAAPVVVAPEEKDLIQNLSDKYRFRVTGIIKSATKTTAIFEWYDEGSRVKERLSMVAIARQGYRIELDPDMESATIYKGKVSYVATQFPLESIGEVSRDRQLAAAPGPAALAK